MRCLFLLLTVCALTNAAAADPAARADAYLERAIEEHGIPALSAAIAVDGEIRWAGAAGLADVENGVRASTRTSFRIASISKVPTAVAVLRLAELAEIDLDASVQTYLPDYPAPRRGTMTVRHLLEHTSGIRHSKGDESRLIETRFESMRDACRFFERRKLASVPGTKYRYSSYGYTVLGAIVEAVTGGSFEAALAEHVWEPAGMTRTALDRRPSATGDDVARLYRREGKRLVPDVANDLSLIHPGGGMTSTAEDLLRFTLALEQGRLLAETSRRRMFERPTHAGKVLFEQGGLGWNVWDHERHGRILSRVGGQSGASALLLSYADRGVTVALLANVARLDPIWELTNDLIGMGMGLRED